MSRYSGHDEYTDPATGVLKNRLGITDEATLEKTEAQFVAQRSYELVQDPLPGAFDLPHLHAHPRHLFGDLYDWAGELRTVEITKDTSRFAHHAYLERAAGTIFRELAEENHLRGLEPATFSRRAAHDLAELNALHPFRDGNGRAQREFLSQLAREHDYAIAWEQITQADMLDASRRSFSGDLTPLTTLIQHHLHRDVPLHAHQSAQASRSTQAAPPLTPPSDAVLHELAERERNGYRSFARRLSDGSRHETRGWSGSVRWRKPKTGMLRSCIVRMRRWCSPSMPRHTGDSDLSSEVAP